MITLITGVPGSGKTSFAVAEAAKEAEKGRLIFVVGIPELTIPHQIAPPVAEWTAPRVSEFDSSIIEFDFIFPPGSLIIIDEAQKIYRPRASGSKAPPHVQALETHRHEGIDFWLLTQRAALLDGNLRGLVGRHFHIRDTWVGRRSYEWAECADGSSRSDLARAIVRPYKLNKGSFSLYKSSSLHLKSNRKIPWQAWALLSILFVVSGAVWFMNARFQDRIHPASVIPSIASQVDTKSSEHPAWEATGSAATGAAHTGATYQDFMPREPARPESAPAYDQIRVVTDFPRVAACIASEDDCRCVTQQATPAFLSIEQCREWIRNPPFDPYRSGRLRSGQQQASGSQVSSRSAQSTVADPINQRSLL